MENQIDESTTITFDIAKKLKKIRVLGQGGTGLTILAFDDITNSYFAIKKYVTADSENKNENFKRFIQEIKILYQISHPNIVRVFNYYLYPENTTGYIQMEYIEGKDISCFVPSENETWENLFEDSIKAFQYLETKGILHRDIRPSNFLITNDNMLKIIDFGFGKIVADIKKSLNDNSIRLNWPFSTMPNEIYQNEYTEQTEIFFLGVMFKNLTKNYPAFAYQKIIGKMCQEDKKDRYFSFSDIQKEMQSNFFLINSFTASQRHIFKTFSDSLVSLIIQFNSDDFDESTTDDTIKGLQSILRVNSIDNDIISNNGLINCFVSHGNYSFHSKIKIPTELVKTFFIQFQLIDPVKQQIVLDEIFEKIKTIRVQFKIDENDLPF